MSKQKLIIKKLGPVENVEIEIDDFMVFIGPQAGGKSTIAKAIFFYFDFKEFFNYYVSRSDLRSLSIEKISELAITKFKELFSFLNNKSEVDITFIDNKVNKQIHILFDKKGNSNIFFQLQY